MQRSNSNDNPNGTSDGPKPIVAITMGDPGGVGPEVIVKALSDPEIRRLGRFIIYGFEELLAYAADRAEINPFWWREPHDQVRRIESGVIVADFDDLQCPLHIHQATAAAGEASMQFLDEAVTAVKSGFAHAIVTAPICKQSWRLAGYRFPGHTEFLAKMFNARRVTMMFTGGPFKVALASTHEPLSAIADSFSIGRVFQPIDLLDQALREWWGIANPRIAVCGLNPHAGEEGQFGDEEDRIIKPAILMSQENGVLVEGPFPADTLFWKASKGHNYDGIVAMYHDQGLIPVKMVAFDSAVNVTLGLPTIRTSPDHGTAFDIAGKNLAHPGSMTAAIELACKLAAQRTAVLEAAATEAQP
jgi:4-phospho-D-threonate 3-dehydrogenase / 4-phospho-D-erythronate 3-dehydrogenase